jgi:Holliday junction resolvase RusA-like endonuclease
MAQETMSQRITFTVPGEPVAKGRPRLTTVNGFARAYTPKKTANYESLVAMAAQSAGCPLFEGPVSVCITAYWQCPKSRERKRGQRPAEWKVTKPDADNIGKSVTDGLNGIAWRDDAQVSHLEVIKVIGAQGEQARVEVVIEALYPMEELQEAYDRIEV